MLGGHTTKALADGIARSQHIGVVVKEEHSSHLDPVRPLLQLRKDHPSKLVAGRVAGSGEHIGDLLSQRESNRTPHAPRAAVRSARAGSLIATFAERSSCGRSSKALVSHRRRSGGSTARSGRRVSVPQLGLRAGPQLAVPRCHSTVVLHLPPPLRARVAIATVGGASGGAGGWLVDRKLRSRPVGSRGACLARGHARSRTR